MFSEGSGRGLAHPRACGENVERGLHRCGGEGSSPRVRGKLDGVDGGAGHVRLIPARAGKTRARPGRKRFRRAHPRACGENAGADPRCVNEVGSSPRVRGKQELPRIQAQAPGLIPARAGKTSTPTSKACPPKAHPRACGENSARHMRHAPPGGSSPRVRGKPGPPVRNGSIEGLIPARAGKTGPPARPRGRPAAHPRACGENAMHACARATAAGSSPRVRGKRRRRAPSTWTRRLIPARAGKTSTWCSSIARPRAHPRACGENSMPPGVSPPSSGSSPRVRGKRRMLDDFFHLPGLIPARAGKTYAPPIRPETSRAHPRACGENSSPSPLPVVFVGSSPRVRGKRSDSHRGRSRAGLIPARAGKTGGSVCRSRSPRAHPRACGENAS